MRVAVRELVRRPGRFAIAGGALTLLMVLLLLLGGLLDGLYLGSTGAISSQPGDAIVYSDQARDSFIRSRIDPQLREQVEAVDGVAATGGLGFALLGAAVPGEDELADVAVAGYKLPPEGVPEPPPPGEAWADRRLRQAGVEEGDELRVGPAQLPLVVRGFVESNTSYLLQGSLWVEPGTWREIQTASRPDAAVADGVFQVLVVEGDDGADATALARAIDDATGATSTLTSEEAVESLPGTSEQRSTFNALLGFTVLVAGLVTALFFALLTLERSAQYATFKAVGARSSTLFLGVVLQAVVVAAGAVVAGVAVALALAAVIPAGVPLDLEVSRAVTSAVLVLVTAAVGGAISLRRIVRIDPASAIG